MIDQLKTIQLIHKLQVKEITGRVRDVCLKICDMFFFCSVYEFMNYIEVTRQRDIYQAYII